MKLLLSSLVVLFSSASFAAKVEVCTAAYSVGVAHFFKAESHRLTDEEQFNVGKKVQDDLYVLQTKLVKGKLAVKLTQKSTGQAVEMKPIIEDADMTMLSTAGLTEYPDGVPGAGLYDGVYLMMICGPKMN